MNLFRQCGFALGVRTNTPACCTPIRLRCLSLEPCSGAIRIREFWAMYLEVQKIHFSVPQGVKVSCPGGGTANGMEPTSNDGAKRKFLRPQKRGGEGVQRYGGCPSSAPSPRGARCGHLLLASVFSSVQWNRESKTISRKGLAALYGLVATSAAWGSTVHLSVPRFTHFISERVEFWPLMCLFPRAGGGEPGG